MNDNSYEKRIVQYEKIHSIDERDFDILVSAVNPQNGQTILDVCCGYGAVSKRINTKIEALGLNTKLILLDNSPLQISRAKENFKDTKNIEIIEGDATKTGFPDEYFDTIVNKMGLHEVPQNIQELMMQELYRILKTDGKIVIWELALSPETQPIFSKIIRKKDELANFDSLVRNRYFPKKEDTLQLLENTGFKNVQVVNDVYPILSIRNRKEEFVSADRLKILEEKGFIDDEDQKELDKISEEKILLLLDFVRNELTDQEKEIMGFNDIGDDILLTAQKAIFQAFK
jgi:ubiquinone/menaquinone biosynthesis C-methylase UbiE